MNAVINLHYSNDALLFGRACLAHVMILKWILLCYKKWSRLRINFHKSAFQGKPPLTAPLVS